MLGVVVRLVFGRVFSGRNVLVVRGACAVGAVVCAGSLFVGVVAVSGCSLLGGEVSGAGSAGVAWSGVERSAGQAVEQSGGGSGGEVQMSGEYRVGADGKLVSPVDPLSVPVPVLGSEAQFETPEGMEAFAKYVIELIPYTWMTGNTSKLEDISLPECTWCADVVAKTQNRVKQGGWVQDASMEILASTIPFEIPDHPGLWHTEIEYVRPSVHSYDGTLLRHVKEDKGIMIVQGRFESARWVLFAAAKKEEQR